MTNISRHSGANFDGDLTSTRANINFRKDSNDTSGVISPISFTTNIVVPGASTAHQRDFTGFNLCPDRHWLHDGGGGVAIYQFRP